jgi:hypothetical protein
MAGTFDSNIHVMDFGPYTTQVASAKTATALYIGSLVLPYDAEVVNFSAIADAVSDGTAATSSLDNDYWVDIQIQPVNPNTGALGTKASLTPPPSQTVNITKAKVDQGVVTFAVVAADIVVGTTTTTAAASSGTGTAVLNVTSATNYAVGQGVIGTGVPFGTKILSISSNALTLDRNHTVAAGVTVNATKAGLPAPNTFVTVAGITDSFFKNFNSNTAGYNINQQAPLFWKVLEAKLDASNNFLFKVGPVNQSQLFDINTGFWKFTTTDATNAQDTVLPGCTTLSAGTVVTANPIRLKSSSTQTAAIFPPATTEVNSVANTFQNNTTYKAGTRFTAQLYKVNSLGAYNVGNASASATPNLVVSMAIKKV